LFISVAKKDAAFDSLFLMLRDLVRTSISS
jgi:hypothetical protein